jgi:hypothetical protein
MNATLTSAEAGLVDTLPMAFFAPRFRVDQPDLPSRRGVPANVREVIDGMLSVLDGLLHGTLEARTGAEFDERAPEAFRKYAALALSLAKFVRVAVDASVAEALSQDSLRALDAEFKAGGAAQFGQLAQSQVLFTIWTFRKTNDLISAFSTTPAASGQAKQDAEYAAHYLAHGLRSQFALDCLAAALRTGAPVFPEVLDNLVEWLRNAVNAYSFARQAFDLRFPQSESLPLTRVWDQEDLELAT